MSESVPSQSTDQSTDSDSRITRTYGRTHEDLGGDEREMGYVSNAHEGKHIFCATTGADGVPCGRKAEKSGTHRLCWQHRRLLAVEASAGECAACPLPSGHLGKHIESNLERLMRWVDTSAGPEACWPWIGGRDRRGYGDTYLYRAGRRIKTKASRAVYVATHGDLSPDIFVLHACDNPPCCNPAHLRPGTHLENMYDRKTRGAGYPRGEDNWNTVPVSDDVVAAIRAEYRWNVPGFGTPALAKRYGLGRGTVQGIVMRTGRWAESA